MPTKKEILALEKEFMSQFLGMESEYGQDKYNDGFDSGVEEFSAFLQGKLDELEQPVEIEQCLEDWENNYCPIHWAADDKIKAFWKDYGECDDNTGEFIGSYSFTKELFDYAEKTDAKIINQALSGNYTVKKEQLYYVRIPETDGYVTLKQNTEHGGVWFSFNEGTDRHKNKFTEAEIKAIDERYWAFAVPVEEETE